MQILTSLFSYLWLGFFSALAFAPFSFSSFAWLAPFPLFWIEKQYRGQWKILFLHGLGFGIVFYSCSFHWIYHMVTVFGGFPWFLALPIFFLSGAFLNLKFPVFLLLFSFLIRKVRKHKAALAGFSVLFSEFFTPQVFPWYWGNVVGENVILAQTAEFASAYGLSVFLFFGSYLLFRFVRLLFARFSWMFSAKKLSIHWVHLKKWALKPSTWLQFSIIFLWVVIFWGSGFYLFRFWSDVTPIGYREVGVIQPDAPLEFRDSRKSFRDTIEDLMLQIDLGAREVSKGRDLDLLVLPESSVPFFSANSSVPNKINQIYWNRFDNLIALLALRHNTNVFFNELDIKYKGELKNENKRYYNSSSVYDPSGKRQNSYDKVFLLIFGEYMPFDWMYALSPQTAHFAPGTSLDLLPYFARRPNSAKSWQDLKWEDTDLISKDDLINRESSVLPLEKVGSFLPLICYEVIIPEFVRQFEGDPDFIVNVTNDKWYGNSIESYQHYTLGRLRAIEFRKWIVRSTNSGTSVFIDHLGRPVDGEFTPIESSAVLAKKVAVIPGKMTFYRRFGNVIPWTYLGISSILFIYYVWKRA